MEPSWTGGLTGVVRVRLQAVDHVVVGFEQHEVLCCVSVPDEDVSAVGAAHHKVVAPETRLLYLKPKNHFELFNTLQTIKGTDQNKNVNYKNLFKY